jgi:hypothetical protein
VWDYKPSAEKLASESGWREAVEIMPDLVDNREIMTTHQIDIDVEPAQIVWSKRELEVDERKSGLESQAKAAFKTVVDAEVAKETDQYPETQYDAAVVALRGSCSRHGWTRSLPPRPTRLLTRCKE